MAVVHGTSLVRVRETTLVWVRGTTIVGGGRCAATEMLGETVPARERLGWGGDKRGVVVGDGKLKDDASNVEPVRSHAGVNMAGPPAC